MSILVDEKTKLIVQGITGREGQFHAEQCMKYGRKRKKCGGRDNCKLILKIRSKKNFTILNVQ